MFPTISHFIEYFTGIKIGLPIQTFGFFVALAFWTAYLAFKKEFKRKEKSGLIHPYLQTNIVGQPASLKALLAWGLAGFTLGYKLVFLIVNYERFAYDSAGMVFSWEGNYWGGIAGFIFFVLWIYILKKQDQLDSPVAKEVMIYPHQQTDRLLLWCAAVGFIGAVLFPKFEELDKLFSAPRDFFTSLNGLAFYGGLIFGAGIFFYKTKKMGISLLTAADIGSPGMMLAYAVGRMGCHLSGDGDWGRVNLAPKPGWLSWLPDWAWSYKYPHNVIHQGRYIEGCGDSFCNVLIQPVFPTSLYESLLCLFIFATLWFCRGKITRPGEMFFIFLLCNGVERFFMEFIKVNPVHCVANLCLAQSQFIAIALCLWGLGGLTWLTLKNKNHSTS